MVLMVLIQYFQLLHPPAEAEAVLDKAGVHRLGVMVKMEAPVVEVAMVAVAALQAAPAIHQAQAHLKEIMVEVEVVLVILIPAVVVAGLVQLVLMLCPLAPVAPVVPVLLTQLQDQQQAN